MGSSDFDRIFGRFSSQPAFDTQEFVPGGRIVRFPMVCRTWMRFRVASASGLSPPAAINSSSVSPQEPSASGQWSLQDCGRRCSTVSGALDRHVLRLAVEEGIAEALEDVDELRVVHDAIDVLRHPCFPERFIARPAGTAARRAELLGECAGRELRLLERPRRLEEEPVVVLGAQAENGPPEEVGLDYTTHRHDLLPRWSSVEHGEQQWVCRADIERIEEL